MSCCDSKADKGGDSCCGNGTAGDDAAANGAPEAMTHEDVSNYYGKVLAKSDDLQTNACCTGEKPPQFVREGLARVHPEVCEKYYGCGLVLPEELGGARILDLGCGAGRDCYLLSQFVGESGRVVGVDMTDEQLAVANRHVGWHAEKFGYAEPNTEFHKGYIEKLEDLGLAEGSFDVVVSNCVINLCPDKRAVLKGIHRILKAGGELYFSDVYASRRVPEDLRQDPVLWGECLSGALYWNDFLALAKECGFGDPRLVKDAPITVQNKAVEARCGTLTSTPPPTACSRSPSWSRTARTTARRWCTTAAWRGSRSTSTWTATTGSTAARWRRCAATRGAFWRTRGSSATSPSSATGRSILASSPAAARTSPSPPTPPAAAAAGGAAKRRGAAVRVLSGDVGTTV